MSRCLLGLSGALLLASCGSSSPADHTTTIAHAEPARAVASIGDSPPTLTADDLAAAAAFYRRKTVSIIVGSGAGEGFDTTARLVARHIGRHIPGTPTVIVVSHRILKHPTKRGIVVVAGHSSKDMKAGTLQSAWKQAGLV